MIQRFTVFALLLGLAWPAAAQETRIFISVDMEGLAGAMSGQQVGHEGIDYPRFREFMTEEVNAVIDGARAAGATEFVVADSHGNKQNLLIDQLPDDVNIVSGDPRPLSMMQGIDDGEYDGAIFVGYHASASHLQGVMAHTMSGGTVFEMLINGQPATEGLINAAIAGEYGVPVIMVSGDDAAVDEVANAVGDMERAAVKRAVTARSGITMTPAAAQALLRQKAEAAVARISDFKPFHIASPVTLDLTFRRPERAEILSWLPIVERTGVQSIRYRADSILGIQYFLKFALTYPGN